jgi:hypothetical protein
MGYEPNAPHFLRGHPAIYFSNSISINRRDMGYEPNAPHFLRGHPAIYCNSIFQINTIHQMIGSAKIRIFMTNQKTYWT